MNDRPSSGQYPDLGYDGLATTTLAGDSAYASYETQGQGYNYAAAGSYGTSYDTGTGAYDATAWTTPQSGYSQQPETGGYDGYLSTVPTQGISTDYQSTAFGYDTWSTPGYGTETGAYDATAWNTASEPQSQQTQEPQQAYAYGYEQVQEQAQATQQAQHQEQQYTYEYTYEAPPVYTETAVFEVIAEDDAHTGFHGDALGDSSDSFLGHEGDATAAADAEATADADFRVHDLPTQAMPVTPPAPALAAAPSAPRASRRAGNTRRRTPAKRSALLTVAVPSACVMGVAGVAAASVGGLTGAEQSAEATTTMAAPDPASVKPVAANSKLDTQLTALSADAGDFADRASRTQERIDLRLRQDEEKKKKAEEEAAKEAARPKFALPVARHGLSAGFGQAGVNWMSVHTGIDFPVSYGSSVMAATDGTVRSQWNSAYGNMVILTAPDGTETWYCHLSSAKIRSGKVKAGDVIAYSGNSGNSTGPHLHFEVRPGGGSPVDPQAWLRSHDLDPN
ncbi:M23 family metallopeptidase [Streptomyces sp. ISL-66]|uniref:M23 family metallopeptidase n=1 Tax=Streptomyces sp. ISL-66 TaxID=2819186 RepID=UPI001BE6D01B|nr:M23 family metallopeptidase [Streptomyces sp. ISL-66]MBT2467678.1 M23 family metallopeptidase [Streptomyces sp. ISL-66]